MSGGLQKSLSTLISQTYYPSLDLVHLLHPFLHAAMMATASARGEIRLRDLASATNSKEKEILIIDGEASRLVLCDDHDNGCSICATFYGGGRIDPLITHDLAGQPYCSKMMPLCGSSIIVPIQYQEATIGVMAFGSQHTRFYSKPKIELCQSIANQIAYLVKRHELSWLIKMKLGKDQILIGVSDELRRVDEFIEKASRVELPVLIIGEFGTEKEYIAYAVHFASPRCESSFLEVNCSTLSLTILKSQLSDLFRKAEKATVFFNGIDELEYKLQYQLSEILDAGFAQWIGEKSVDARIVASTSGQLNKLVMEGRICRPLLWKFDFLHTRIAPLRDREEDVKSLTNYFLEKYAKGEIRKASDEVLQLCLAYNWPGNTCELERVIARLAVMSEGEIITLEGVYSHAPELVEGLGKLKGQELAVAQLDRDFISGNKAAKRNQIYPSIAYLAQNLIEENFVETAKFHPGLQKALVYLAQKFPENFYMADVARHACISSSHLSYLFQKTLNTNFKSLLAIIRIERAKQLLKESRYLNITEISSEVGFSEHRHFQRTFKRLVGCTAREYRCMTLEKRQS